ncbi:MAG: ABC transporter ATP-binding protein [Defluviitaleaceae bacterium]|nr:ABC transporter ATP-binding protein [Defluviitaleaceae bacterium]
MLSIQGVSKYYGNVSALKNATLTLQAGEVIGLFGANGAGKSTLLKTVMGLNTTYSGWVSLDNAPIKNEAYEKITLITEEGSFFPDMNPRDHGTFYGEMLPRWNHERYGKLLDFFELPPDKKARTLSKGQRAKLEIAVGMCRGADYILMDEPFLGKDLFTRREFLKLLIAISQPDEAVLIATHQIEEIEMYITRAVVINNGAIVGDTSADALSEAGETLTDYIKHCCGFDENKGDVWAAMIP